MGLHHQGEFKNVVHVQLFCVLSLPEHQVITKFVRALIGRTETSLWEAAGCVPNNLVPFLLREPGSSRFSLIVFITPRRDSMADACTSLQNAHFQFFCYFPYCNQGPSDPINSKDRCLAGASHRGGLYEVPAS